MMTSISDLVHQAIVASVINVRSSPTGYIMMLALSIKRVICEVLCVCVCYGIYEHFREVLVAAFYSLCAEETLD